MIDQANRVQKIFQDELNRIRLADVVSGTVNGPCYVMSPQGLTVGWMLLVTLKHNVLLGQPDIGVAVPIMGVLPPDDIFKKGAQYVLEEARKLRDEANHPQVAPQEGALEGQVIPPGMKPIDMSGFTPR